MSADLHIHVMVGITEEDLAIFFQDTMGSKYCIERTPSADVEYDEAKEIEEDAVHRKVIGTPAVWVGEVSWLKAWLTDDKKTFIPGTIARIEEIIGEKRPVINDKFIDRIMKAFSLKNKTTYKLAKPQLIKTFLQRYRGKRVFTISY